MLRCDRVAEGVAPMMGLRSCCCAGVTPMRGCERCRTDAGLRSCRCAGVAPMLACDEVAEGVALMLDCYRVAPFVSHLFPVAFKLQLCSGADAG